MKKIEDLFKTGLENFEVGLPEGDWENFQKASATADSSKKSVGMGLFKYLIPAALAAGIALLFLLLPNNNAPENAIEIVHPTEPVPVTSQVVETTAENIDKEISFSESHSGTKSDNEKSSLDAMAEYITPESDSSGGTTIEGPSSNGSATDVLVEQDEMTADQIDNKEQEKTEIFIAGPKPAYSINNVYVDDNHKKGKISIGKVVIPISAIAVAGASALLSGGGGMMGAKSGNTELYESSEPPHWKNENDPQKYEIAEEAFPIVAGASVRFNLAPRWSIVSGIDYSMRKVISLPPYGNSITSKAHYLGIPIRADYSFPLNKHFEIYAGAGMKLDLCIASKTDYSLYSEEKKQEISCTRFYKSPPKFGLMACGGVQFNIIDELGIYLEPNAAYFFSGSAPKFMLSVNTGIRYTPRKK